MLATLPFFASMIVEYASIGDYEGAFWNLGFFGACFATFILVRHWNFMVYSANAIYVHNTLQHLVLEKVSSFNEGFSSDISSGFITNTAFNDIDGAKAVDSSLANIISYVIIVMASIVMIFITNSYIGLFTLAVNILAIFLMSKNLAKRDYYLANQREEQDKVVNLFNQVVEGSKEVQSFNMDQDLDEYLEGYKKSWNYAHFAKRKYQDRVFVHLPMFLKFGNIAIYAVLIYLIMRGDYGLGSLVLVIGYYKEAQNRSEKLFAQLEDFSSLGTKVSRIRKILNYKTQHMLAFGANELDNIDGRIEFQDVSLAYEKQVVLKNASFEIKPNSFVAIVGKSGSGKSTIFKILLRLYKIKSGQVLLDGVDINDFTKDAYASNISIVNQKPFVFNMSIRDNLNLVDPNTDNQIAACQKVGVHDFIMSLPQGYNTKLTQDATNISGGQKQLISIARTLLSRSEILLFDEVTSILDHDTTKRTVSIMKSLKKHHTILMITHKPNLMRMADRIIVVDHGRIVGNGKHKDLMRYNKYYKILQK
jgi:ATP-binding cassette subfamily B protein